MGFKLGVSGEAGVIHFIEICMKKSPPHTHTHTHIHTKNDKKKTRSINTYWRGNTLKDTR